LRNNAANVDKNREPYSRYFRDFCDTAITKIVMAVLTFVVFYLKFAVYMRNMAKKLSDRRPRK